MSEQIHTSDEIRQGLEDLAFIHKKTPHKTDLLILRYLEAKLDQALRREAEESINDLDAAFSRYLPKQQGQKEVRAF